jgi:hypothetical protein
MLTFNSQHAGSSLLQAHSALDKTKGWLFRNS